MLKALLSPIHIIGHRRRVWGAGGPLCHMHASRTWWLQIMPMRQTSLIGFVKSTSSVGCVGAESNAQLGNLQGHILLA